MEQDGEEIPMSSKITDIALPAWLAAKADEDGVNCSRFFQNALMEYPGVHSTTK